MISFEIISFNFVYVQYKSIKIVFFLKMKYVTHKKRSNGEGSVFFTTTRCFEFLVPEYTMYVCEGGKRESIDSNCVRVCVCVCT